MLNTDILVVDDDAQMRMAMSETLKRNRYSVSTAATGVEAIERLTSEQFRLIITDLRMPSVSGLDVLREVKSVSPRTQVVLVTAYATVNNAVEAMKLGAFDYLVKPFSTQGLEDVVHRALKKNESFLTVSKSSTRFPLVTRHPDMLATLELAEHAAKGRATVLIQAESGTGKELLARWIHQNSSRAGGPFVAVNCAALPEHLLEAELFGYEKGAFTGATSQKLGKFELAHEGTILLDEIGEMVPLVQAKLLRVLQEQEVDRLGGRKPIAIDVRVIATTNKDLKTLVREGTFREDLYYRLDVIRLGIPPLRRRREDVVLLADYFCEKYGIESGGKKMELSPDSVDIISRYDWPGNVRELENAIQRGTAVSLSGTITPRDLRLTDEPINTNAKQATARSTSIVLDSRSRMEVAEPAGLDLKPGLSVSEMERRLIELTLAETAGNRTRAAQLLGISLRTLRNKLREYRQAHPAGTTGLAVFVPRSTRGGDLEMGEPNGQDLL
jgi:DNA-binding NtrC family response regulator